MIKADDILQSFFKKASTDFRINKSHLAVFVAIVCLWQQNGYPTVLVATGREVMSAAKISSDSTYYRIVIDLNKFGYIRYSPSFYKKHGSKIILKI
ncbi:hypothetical protein ABIE26_002939 [Pedobacter africanus]